jgi:hypothetical protein
MLTGAVAVPSLLLYVEEPRERDGRRRGPESPELVDPLTEAGRPVLFVPPTEIGAALRKGAAGVARALDIGDLVLNRARAAGRALM